MSGKPSWECTGCLWKNRLFQNVFGRGNTAGLAPSFTWELRRGCPSGTQNNRPLPIFPNPNSYLQRFINQIFDWLQCLLWSSLDAIIHCTVILPVSVFYFKVDKKPSIIIITLVYTILLTLPNNVVSTFTTQHTLSTNLNK